MIPILYSPDETAFTTNGLGALADAIECRVEEERNGAYTLTMVYPVDGQHYGELTVSSLIKAYCGDRRQTQVFRVTKLTRPMAGRVTVQAVHLSYQLSYIPCTPFSASTVGDALSGLVDHAAEPCPFSFWTNKATVATYTQDVPASIRSRLGGVQGSILDVYGGEWEFDMYTCRLWASRGNDNGVTLRYGKNLVDLSQEVSIENTITGVCPYWTNGEQTVTLPERVISAASADNYPFPHTVPLDCSQAFKEPPTEAQLRTYATSYVNRSGVGVPRVAVKVEFVNLRDTEEYKDVAALERVELCDYVTVIYDRLGVSAKAEVTKTAWDVLAERYISIDVGDIRSSLAQTISEAKEEAEKAVDPSALTSAVQKATDILRGVTGGYIRWNTDASGQPYEMLIMDSDSEATATYIWRYSSAGWGFSRDGGATYTTAATLDGGIVADYITAGTLTGLIINNGNGTFYVNENGEVTARSIAITGGSVNINGSSEDAQIISLTYTGTGVSASFAPNGIDISGGGYVTKISAGDVWPTQIYYDANNVSQLRGAHLQPDALVISDSGSADTARYDIDWYQQLNRLYNAGVLTNYSTTNVTSATGSWVNAGQLAHGAGLYLVTAYYSISANTSGYRTLMLTNSATGSSPITPQARARVAAAPGTETTVSVTTIVKVTASGTWYMRTIQNSGATLTITAAEIRAVKLSD